MVSYAAQPRGVAGNKAIIHQKQKEYTIRHAHIIQQQQHPTPSQLAFKGRCDEHLQHWANTSTKFMKTRNGMPQYAGRTYGAEVCKAVNGIKTRRTQRQIKQDQAHHGKSENMVTAVKVYGSLFYLPGVYKYILVWDYGGSGLSSLTAAEKKD
eukprot:jgi/Psemu1/19064/gm1.19064_g